MLRVLLLLPLLASAAPQGAPSKLVLEKGDRLCILGNTLADRMQHHGWLETFLQSRFPDHELVIRNLGFSADELTVRLRSSNFGSPDSHLQFNRADVVFAFFGYNESFGGEAGLPKFRKDLDEFLKKTLAQKYNGKSAPRLVLFSPIAHENLKSPHLPDGAENNARLELYTRAMAEAAAAAGVPFVDLFGPTRALYGVAGAPSTLNGIHLNEHGDRRVGEFIDAALFGPPPARRDPAFLEKLRSAVLEKNFFWYQKYRATDGFSTYGGRADLKFLEGQTNRVVMQRELEVLDTLTANRDRRIWAVARGGDLKVDDSSTPPFIPVKTNKPGTGAGGEHVFLEADVAVSRMQVAKGMKVKLFASEEKFPELANPVQMAFDPKGRLWVAAWPTYPHWKPKEPMNDKLLIFEDEDGDGAADRCKVFAGDLHNPTGFEFWNGGVLVAMAPGILFLKDTDGDDRPDIRERVVEGLDTADTHHTANSFVLDPGGALYFQEGTFHHTQVETPWGPARRCVNGGVYRYEPRAQKFDVFVSYGYANPHGHVFDRWGQNFLTDGTGANTYFAVAKSGRVEHPRKHPGMPQVYKQRTRPCPATEFLSSRHFPEENQGNLLVCNVIGYQGILQYRFSDKGSGFSGQEVEPIVQSSDPNFRPSDVEIGPDGAIWFTDWHNPIIGHMQHNLRDPSRDRIHGRIYRVTCMDRPPSKPLPVAGEPVAKLLDLLKEPEDRVRYRARIELGGRKTDEVLAAAKAWLAGLDKGGKDYEHHRLEGLWLHQNHDVVNEPLLKEVLRSPEPRARAAATRVLRYWRDRVPSVLALLEAQANDEHPRVRLEAVVAASEFREARAAGLALLALKRERDEYIDYALKETLATLDPLWRPALREGNLSWAPEDPAVVDYLLGLVGTAELLKLPRTAAVQGAILTRSGLPLDARREALAGLARSRNTDEVGVLLGLIEAKPASMDDLARLLGERPAAELARSRERMAALAEKGSSSDVRRTGYAAWIAADGSADAAAAAALKTPEGTRDFLDAVRLIADERLRAGLYDRVRKFLGEVSGSGGGASKPGLQVDYFDSAPPNVAIETLAKLKPAQSGTAAEITLDLPVVLRRDAFALRFAGALRVPTDGAYTFFTESDDGSRLYLGGKLVVDNDGLHGMNEKSGKAQLKAGNHPLVVTYFDNGGGDGLAVSWQGPGIRKQKLPREALGSDAPDSLLDAAIGALSSIPGRDREKFRDLAGLVLAGRGRAAAVKAIRKLDPGLWDAGQASRLIDTILGWATSLPADQRTQPAAVEALQFGRELAALLPAEAGKAARAKLQDLGVRIIVLRPVPHQMVFDRKRIVVEAGKPVEIVLENQDLMPHNLVITAPGAMEEVGKMAESMGLEGQAKDYLPQTPKILWSTKLVLPGHAQKIVFTAPKDPGKYPYVCTFPGHWMIMNGTMEVVAPGSPALGSDAEPEQAAHAAPQRPFVRMWTLADFDAELKLPLKGRSHARGKEMFAVAGCVKCHVVAGEGGAVGPDLTRIAEKYKGRDLFLQVLEPSSKIEDPFRAHLIQTTDGETLSGLVAKEDGTELHLKPAQADGGAVIKLPKSRIQARKPMELSPMPTGLLTTLQKEEVLDLLGFVEAGGDPRNPIFTKP